jgi:hypothetical protein
MIEEGQMDKLSIKITNHLTGEITEVEVTSAEQAKNLLLELTASKYVIAKAQENIRSYLDKFLGNDKEYQFADGKVLRRKQITKLIYKVESLRKYLDEDQIDVVLKVDTTAANALIQEMMERQELPGDTLKKIREEADVRASSEFVEVR